MTRGGGVWVPENDRQHPPFEAGNELNTRHGAYSPRHVDPIAAGLVEAMLGVPTLGYLAAPEYRPALWGWAKAEAQAQLLTEYLERRAVAAEAVDPMHAGVGDLDDERVKSAYLLLHRAEARALSGRQRLGLDPLSRARLGKDVAQGQAADAVTTLTLMRTELERLKRAQAPIEFEVAGDLAVGVDVGERGPDDHTVNEGEDDGEQR